MKNILVPLMIISSVICVKDGQNPEQIHISFGRLPSEMIVTWTTMNRTEKPMVKYGTSSFSQSVEGYTTVFDTRGVQHRIEYVHRAVMTQLKQATTYSYRCGSDSGGWSNTLKFTSKNDSSAYNVRMAVFGDMGNVNAQSLTRLLNDTQKGMYDLILHVGDFAYDLDTDNGTVGDDFMNQIQPIASQLPYMTCPGNHEIRYNFTHYKNRFTMPTDEHSDRMFYSFDVGRAHIISISTEYYFAVYYGIWQPGRQYEWLISDLAEANKPENRAERPWIIVMGHRPMYCSNNNKDDCTHYESIIRTGWPITHSSPLESLFYNYGVDLEIWAHEHSYERLWPVYNFKVKNGSYEHPYTNPKAPVHVITGSAGCAERHDNFINGTRAWSAFRNDDYGYSRMNIINKTHLYWEQVSDDQDGKIIDRFTLIKDKHGPYE